jgi:hypothetical protein
MMLPLLVAKLCNVHQYVCLHASCMHVCTHICEDEEKVMAAVVTRPHNISLKGSSSHILLQRIERQSLVIFRRTFTLAKEPKQKP